jgi:succinate-semialdehyde dehydrogenase/glutarate-semialdehyde dehydrogenase
MGIPVAPAEADLAVQHSLLGFRPVEGRAGRRPVTSPVDAKPFAEVSLLDREQAGQALDAARAAFPAWSRLGFAERGRYLLRLRDLVLEEADELAALIAREQGKPASEAHAVEIFPAMASLEHLALHAGDVLRDEELHSEVLLFAHKECRLVYQPYGVVLVITPWNYPFAIPVTGLAAALAAGNTVVLKPAPSTTLIALRLGELCRRAGFPEGTVSVVSVDDLVAASLVEDPRVSKILFTGSVPTGRRIMAAAAKNLTPVVLELGGKDPAIVCRDADLDRAARGIVWGAFLNAGQTCASVERVYVEREVAEPFLAKVVEETRKLRLGDPGRPGTDLGPLTLERQRDIVRDHVAEARSRGAKVLTGGEQPDVAGYYYPPTVLTGVDHSMKIMREETFGPVLPVMAVDSVEEAIRLANDSEYGLTASGWTRDPSTAALLQRELKAGVVTINDCVSSYGEPSAPWGGDRGSGIGRTHGLQGLKEMVQVKYVTADPSRRAAPWWFPYDEEYARMMGVHNRAMHSRSFFVRLLNQLRLLTFPRFWRRASLGAILRNADRLF